MPRFGISVPNFGSYADARVVAELAYEAEQSGWDGFFVWDHIQFMTHFGQPVADPWILMAAIAMRTERVRIGPLVTPVSRRRPWKLARETVSLDHLSGGRLIFGIGIGEPIDSEYEAFGEDGDARVRAAKLDEGMEILTGLWSGEPFSFAGEHFQVNDAHFLPRPLQPRIPVWVAGLWPNRRPFRRAARWDGVAPGVVSDDVDAAMPVDDLRASLAYIAAHRTSPDPFDVVLGGSTSGSDHVADAALVDAYVDAGLTWWIENVHDFRGSFDEMRARVRLGPPRAS